MFSQVGEIPGLIGRKTCYKPEQVTKWYPNVSDVTHYIKHPYIAAEESQTENIIKIHLKKTKAVNNLSI